MNQAAIAPDRSSTAAATFASATETLRSTVRWLLTAAAGVGGFLVAGLQLTSLGSLSLADWRLWAAACGVLVATAGVGYVIVRTSQILTNEWIALAQLSFDDFQARLEGAMSESALLQEIEVYKHELYAHVAETVHQLYQRLIQANELVRAAPSEVAVRRAAELREAADNVVQYANYYETRARFKALSRQLAYAAIAIVLGVLVFAYAANPAA
ncbi:hypothetical protein [Kribbella jiaozuonensis]|uniref:SMODS and SLOG-associating 2TM effector domain-containing protein n=1 Tax=Kribbella jiaozuonensis TaxID=2575441 RepID=A0A4U3M2Y2_9ACTN|nr:hypothetical protein [Kribbella jiaozuonensis]TKK81617.1 hypothetical protein FDA38_01880 [Kribbella jiaozuonensis]